MTQSLDLTGKVVLVAGAHGLLGQEMVKSVREAGGVAVAADIRAPRPLPPDKCSEDEYHEMDICSKKAIQETFRRVVAQHGKIDAIINSTYPRNRNYGRLFEEVEWEDFSENVSMHLGGFFLLTQQAVVLFKQQGFGNLINFASVYGIVSPKFELYENQSFTMPVEYAAIKSGIIHLSRYVAKYLQGTKIRVNCISPGGIRDGQPRDFQERYRSECRFKGMLEPSDISGTVLFLLSDCSSYIHGRNLVVDDGFTL